MASRNFSSGMNSRGPFDFLDLPGCKTLGRSYFEPILVVRATHGEVPSKCPECGSKRMSVVDTKTRIFWDTPHAGLPTLVQLGVSDIACVECGGQIETKLPWLHQTREMTLRLVNFILARAATLSTFAQIALDTGQESTTVIDIFMEAFAKWDDQKGKDLPLTLGIDEVYFHRRPYTILVDSKTGAAVDLLIDRDSRTIENRLRAAPNAKDVLIVTLDFTGPFRDAATKSHERNPAKHSAPAQHKGTFKTPLFGVLPNADTHEPITDGLARLPEEAISAALPCAKIVGDHFHFKQKIGECFDAVRIHVQGSLVGYFLDLEVSKYSADTGSPLFVEATDRARNKATKLVEDRAAELRRNRYILFKRTEKLNDEERLWADRMFLDHPILKKAWDVKNAGLKTIQRKPKTRKEKMAVTGPIEETEVGQRLDDWVLSIDEELQPFFGKAINLITDWRAEIIRIATTDFNNAHAENKNRHLRMLEAIGRGLEFETMRARLLWADAHRRTNRWPSACDGITRMSARKLIETLDALELCGAKINSDKGPGNGE